MYELLFVLLALGFALWFFSKHLDWGLVILAGLAPAMHWQFRLENYRGLLANFPQLWSFYAPMVDVWAVFLIAAFLLHLFRQWYNREKISVSLPGAKFYVLFLLSAVLSFVNLLPLEAMSSFKYIIRFPLFVYLGYLVVGVNIARETKVIERAMIAFIFTSCLGALMGAASLFLGVWGLAGLTRAVPFAIYGFAPFGDQHIFLAEIFISALPLILYFYYKAKNQRAWLSIGIFILLVCVLTFSRAGWLTLALEALVFFICLRPDKYLSRFWAKIIGIGVLLLPFVIYMVWFLESKVVQLSNEARVALTSISWFLFKGHPIFGQGVGTFVDRVSEIQYFVYEFGTPIDAHSWLAKILAEQGILGLTAFALFFGWLFVMAYRLWLGSRRSGTVVLLLLSGPLFFQLFSTQYYSAVMWVPIMFAAALMEIKKKDLSPKV